MASQLSEVRPNAFERRNAISGLTALLPFNTRLNVEVATPRVVASSRPLMSLGSSYTELMNLPGCGGLCIVISGSPRNPGHTHAHPGIQTSVASFH